MNLRPVGIEAAHGTRVRVRGRTLVSFAGCDLLGLARHPAVLRAAAAALARYGASASASRTTTGTLAVHVDLERALARFFGTEDCVVLPAGWMAPAALVAALARPGARIVADAGLHSAGLAAVAAVPGTPVRTYAHFDADDAARALGRTRGGILVTDGADPTAGRLAPLGRLAEVARRAGAQVIVDDAHGAGLLGAHGRGSAESAGAEGPRVHLCGSLSKTFGAGGGFVPCRRTVAERIRRLPAYAGATPLAPPVAAAALEAVRLARPRALRDRLGERVRLLRSVAPPAMRPLPEEGLPWFCVRHASAAHLSRLSRRLADRGLLVPHIRYHGGPPQGILKIAVSAAHTERDIARLAAAL